MLVDKLVLYYLNIMYLVSLQGLQSFPVFHIIHYCHQVPLVSAQIAP